jgi:hypothetical protein
MRDWKIEESRNCGGAIKDEELTGEDAQAWRRRGRHDRNWQDVVLGRDRRSNGPEARAAADKQVITDDPGFLMEGRRWGRW